MKIRSDGVVERLKRVRRRRVRRRRVLPDEIVIEILVRLPVKALLQFKRVCKSWRTLISSPQFAIDNFRRRADWDLPSHLICSNEHCDYSRVGFLSLQPLFQKPSGVTRFVHLGIKFNIGGEFPSDELVIRGSCNGYDHVHDKYKLVTVHEQYLTRTFTFGTNSWTIGPNFPYRAVGLSGKIGKFLSGTGTLNWMARMKQKEWIILSFDLANETFGQVSLPRLSGLDNDYSCDNPELQVSMNCLCFTIQKYAVFEMWMMKEYGVWESWMMIARVDHCYGSLIPLYISERRVLLLRLPSTSLVMYNCDDGLFYYPLTGVDTSSGDEAIQSAIRYRGIYSLTFFVYHDSLVSPPQ
ncbi:hypothetical protein PIB30_067231 [Stylosanthes scabra]|uniref:F-box domain-containing protein n=1 Tax=Stylosanthes scabra TaxID=79078 RepID=A0ABU6ULZ6_9FABA|nr:hypothetical protein [Stylosanthes scabra]